MSRFPIFLVASFLAFFGLIGISLRGLMPTPAQAVEARQSAGALVFDTSRLNQIVSADGFPVMPAPGPRADQIGPRLASFSVLAPDARYSKGARLLFGPRTQSLLAGRPLSLVLTVRATPNSAASRLAVGIVRDGGSVTWIQGAVSPDFAPLRIDIPANAQPATALALWPSVEGNGQGVEIRTITIQPGPQ